MLGLFPRRAEVDQDRLIVRVQQDVVGGNVPMQHPAVVDILDRAERLARQRLDFLRSEAIAVLFDHREQIEAVDVIDRHVSGLVLFEDLVHLDDVLVVERCQSMRFLDEVLHHVGEFFGMALRPDSHFVVGAEAHHARKALLDDDVAAETVLGPVGDAEAAAVEIAGDGVLTVQDPRAGRQFIHCRVDLVPCFLISSTAILAEVDDFVSLHCTQSQGVDTRKHGHW